MHLKKNHETFNSAPFLNTPIAAELLTLDLKHFDKDGYEVPALLERAFYEASNVPLNCEIQYHIAPVQEWYTDIEDAECGLVLDHSMLLTRWAIAGDARKQLESIVNQRPIVNKLLGILPKWGIDFSLDWIDNSGCMEVIHIEQDFKCVNTATEAKLALEEIVDNTDWEFGAKQLKKQRSAWENLSSDDHSDYKARYFGWHRAFDNIKVFT